MARYRKYPNYVPKIEIEKTWADKLKKQNAQQLTLLINKVTAYEKDLKDLWEHYWKEIRIIDDVNLEIVNLRHNKQEEIHARSFGLKKVFNKVVADLGNTKEQDNELRTAILNSKKARNEIDKALIAVQEINKILTKGNLLLKEIDKLFTDSGQKIKPYNKLVLKRADFYDFNSNSRTTADNKAREPIANHIHRLTSAKKSFFEIRKIINKKEKSAKLASYQDKSRNIGKSVMSKMKSEISSPFYCPYCFKKTPKTKIHVDHINPVSNGGLSVERNLVPVCSDCNLNKSDLSLRAFCKKNSYDFDLVCNTLEDMGKFI